MMKGTLVLTPLTLNSERALSSFLAAPTKVPECAMHLTSRES